MRPPLTASDLNLVREHGEELSLSDKLHEASIGLLIGRLLAEHRQPSETLRTAQWQLFCDLWRDLGAHWSTYGRPPHYRVAGAFLKAGGFMAGDRARAAAEEAARDDAETERG